jgi:predicted GTPase
MAEESIQTSSQCTADPSSKLRVVVFGKTGAGKSSLINSLFLSNDTPVAKVGHGLFSETKSVGCYTKVVTMIVNDVHVTLWDTPGLKDLHSDGEKTIREIGERCGDVHLFVYCTRFDQPRLEEGDVNCIRDITKAFGDGIWKRCIFALTFANQAALPPSVTDKSLSEYFQERLEQWRGGLHHFVKEHAKELSGQAISSIPVVPTGCNNLPLPDNRSWLLEFWYDCVAQVKFFALPAMKRMTNHQIKGEAERTAIAGEFEKRMAKEPESADKEQVARGLASLPGSADHGSTVTTSSVDSVDSPGNMISIYRATKGTCIVLTDFCML